MIYVPTTLIRNNMLPEPYKPPVHSFLSYPFSLFQRQPISWILHSSCASLTAFLCMYLLLNKYCLIVPHVELSINELYKNSMGVSLVAQWLRICLPMQGTQVRALVWEDPTCRGVAGPVSHNY